MQQPLRVGIIGCGVIAPAHIESFQRLDNVTVTWACDLVPEKAAALAEKYGIGRTSADCREVLADDDVDIIAVCTDHASHAPVSVAAIEAGKHVLCEKALAASKEGLDAMYDAHRAHPDLTVGGVFQHRFDAANRYLRDLVQEGAFGRLLTGAVQVRCLRTREYYQADAWRGTWAEEGGAVLINQAIHFIDSLVWIMGGVRELAGTYANLTHGDVMETEDTATAALRFKNGALGTLEATCSSHLRWESTISIHGSEGSIDLRQGQGLKVAFDDEAKQQRIEEALSECRDRKTIDAGKSYYGASHPNQIAEFVDAVREKRQPYVTFGSARHTVDVVLAIYRSWHEGRWVPVEDDANP